ncbi:IPTL-CTERM sorting domain-containing protein [Acidovorax lacteus]
MRLNRGLAWVAGALMLAATSTAVLAEGSRSLYPLNYEAIDGGNNGRANLDLTDPNSRYLGVVARRTFVYVYARQNEYILLGSRNRTANGVGAINVYQPQSFGTRGNETIPATADFTCSSGTTGLIANRSEELAGPQAVAGGGVAGGFVPCVYQAPVDGVYGVLFSPSNTGGGPDGSVSTPAVSNTTVSAWDVTVRSSDTTSTVDLNGRVFTYAWTAFTGGNGPARRLYSDLFYATSDGYRYRQTLTGLDLNGGTFFANARGFVDSGDPLYKNIRGTNQPVSTGIPAGVSADPPQYPIFFSNIAPGNVEAERTLTALGIPLTPKPPQVNSFSFRYPPVNSSTSYVGQGGVFRFYVTDTLSFQIVISRDGTDWDPATPTNRVLTGTSGTGEYSVVWDGKDNAGNNFPAGSNYQFRITGRNGEVHFPFVDAEANIFGGPTVTKLNGNVTDSLIYYDDRGYVTRGGTAVGTLNGHICGNATYDNTNPVQALQGVDSSARVYDNGTGPNTAYARSWRQIGNPNSDCASATQGFGDTKALNLWTYQTTTPQSNTLSIVDNADVRATVSAPVSTPAGGTVNVAVGFANVGSQTATATVFTVQLPTGLGDVSCTGATCSYNATTGAVSISGLPGSLSPGQEVNIGLRYTAPATGSVATQATVTTTSSQGANLAPDTASATTLVGGTTSADVLVSLAAPATAVQGGTVAVPVQFANVGASAAPITSYGLQLPAGLSGVGCSGSGITCTYDAGTGTVTVNGAPATLTAGQSLGFTLSYTAPAAGSTVTVNGSVATSATETNTANNTAQSATTTSSTATAPDVLATLSAPVTAAPGSLVEVPVRFSNAGDVTAAGMGYNLTLPTGLTGVSCAAPVSCTYTAGTGAVAVTGLPASLAAGAWANLTLRYTSPAQGVVNVNATVSTTTAGETNTTNNSASGHTTVVTGAAGADVTVTVSPPATVAPGAAVAVSVTVSNLGPLDAQGVGYTLTLPPGLTGVSCSGGATCAYNNSTGAVTVTGLPATLTAGQSQPFTLLYTAPGNGQVAVQASVSSTSLDTNTGNNTAQGTTTVASAGVQADVTTSVAPPSTALAGTTVQVPLQFSNVGGASASNLGYTVQLTGSPTGVAVTYNSVACTYNGGTGAITGCGLPSTLTPGQALNLVLSYTAPASGNVGVTSNVSTTSGESNITNNSATASTAIGLVDMAVNLAGLPTSGSVGTPYSGFFTCTNNGNQTAAGGQCSAAGLPTGVGVTGCTISPGNTAWTAGSAVPAGQTVRCTVAGTPSAAGSFGSSGTTGATGDANAGNNTANLTVTIAVAGALHTAAIPTLGQWSLILLSALVALAGLARTRQGRSLG